MTGKSLGLRAGSYGTLQSSNGIVSHLQTTKSSFLARKSSSKMLLSGFKEKERFQPYLCCFYFGRRRVAMLLLLGLALAVSILGSYTVSKENTSPNVNQNIGNMDFFSNWAARSSQFEKNPRREKNQSRNSLEENTHRAIDVGRAVNPLHHPCENFTFPPPPPPGNRRPGPRPCPVCYLPVEQAMASMPKYPSVSPVLKSLTYVHDENPVKPEGPGGSEFGGYPSLQQRNESFDIKESMKVHCGFVKGSKPGHLTGFDIDENVLLELEKCHDVVVASAIFGKYDLIQQPEGISEAAKKYVPFYMFIDEETEAYLKNSTSFSADNTRVGLWRIVVVRNIPYSDPRRNGKVPKLLLHRLFPNVRFSIWIDGKLQLVVDPYQILERFLWRKNSTFAISGHYRRFDVFEEAEANKAAKKYDNASIDYQIEFYKKEGLRPYSKAKLPITSDVPEGCVIIREHIPITNFFSCLWFNEVERFTSRDQLSFAITRDKVSAKVDWSINMFLDCERRNFVIQVYHRDLLMNRTSTISRRIPQPPALPNGGSAGKLPERKIPRKHGRDRRYASRRHRKVSIGNRDNHST